MKRKNLFLLVGIPGCGKSTWVRKEIEKSNVNCVHISRDEVRFSIIKDDEEYFSHEDEVFDEFVKRIQAQIDSDEEVNVFIDATHINEKGRNKLLDRLVLTENTFIYPVNFKIPLQTCLNQNELRRDIGRTYVPRSVIRRMHFQKKFADENEKFHYEHILNIGDDEE